MLPFSVVLVLLLGISGVSFMQLDWLERRVALNEVDNHGAFYLAQAGLARAQAVLKINSHNVVAPNWTLLLQNLTNDTNRANNPLCPTDPAWQCGIIPTLGAAVLPPDGLVFASTFDDGRYEVRAWNDAAPGETSTRDQNGLLTVRARGTIRGEQKVVEVQLRAVSTANLINCMVGATCPSTITGIPTVDPAPGRAPAVLNQYPQLDYPLTDARNYYRTPGNFSFITTTTTTYNGTVTDGTFYNLTGDVTIRDVTANNVVIFTTGRLTVDTNTDLTNAILIGSSGVQFQGTSTIRAPLTPTNGMYPAVLAGNGAIASAANNRVTIYGNVFTGFQINLQPGTSVYGVLFGEFVRIGGFPDLLQPSTYTDNHTSDPNYLKYYEPMPGLMYGPDMLTTVTVSGTWREIQ